MLPTGTLYTYNIIKYIKYSTIWRVIIEEMIYSMSQLSLKGFPPKLLPPKSETEPVIYIIQVRSPDGLLTGEPKCSGQIETYIYIRIETISREL